MAALEDAPAGSTTDTDTYPPMACTLPSPLPSPSSLESFFSFSYRAQSEDGSPDAMREAIRGIESDLVDLVFNGSSRAPPRLLEDWLKVPLEYATAAGNLSVVKRLLSAGVGTDLPSNGMRLGLLLHTAAGSGHAGVVEEILKSGANVEEVDKDRYHQTALHVAAASGCDAAVRAIASDPRTKVDVTDTRGWTPLHIAAKLGHRGVVVFLLLKGASAVHKTVPTGDSPLHVAAASNHAGVIEDLLSLGDASVGLCNNAGETALHMAVRFHQLEACIALLRGGATIGRVCSQGLSCLDAAAFLGHSLQLLRVLTAGESASDRKRRCSLALYYAAKASHVGTIRDLVALGADINTTRSGGNTNLHYTATRGTDRATEGLLRTGANLEIRNSEGATPLHRACSFSQSSTVQLLLRWGADETATNYDDMTAYELVGSAVEEELLSPEEALSKEQLDVVIRSMLVNAPADRVWRRRGWLVLCRARWLTRIAENRRLQLVPVAVRSASILSRASASSGKAPASKKKPEGKGGEGEGEGQAKGGSRSKSKSKSRSRSKSSAVSKAIPAFSGKGKGQAPLPVFSRGGNGKLMGSSKARDRDSPRAHAAGLKQRKISSYLSRSGAGVAGADGSAATAVESAGVQPQPPQLRLGRGSVLCEDGRESGVAAAVAGGGSGGEVRSDFVVAVERLLLLREEGVFRDIVTFL